MSRGPKPRNPVDRFEEKYEIQPSGCWKWTGAFIDEGYGRFYLDGRVVQAHHAATALYRGVYADGRHGCHTCDNRWCVNPDHIFYGTQWIDLA